MVAGFAAQSLEHVEFRQLGQGLRAGGFELDDLLVDRDRLEGESFLRVGVRQLVKVGERLGDVLVAEVKVPDGIEQGQVGRLFFEDERVLLDRRLGLSLGDKLFSLLIALGLLKAIYRLHTHDFVG
mgnify:CR=1 FL=1